MVDTLTSDPPAPPRPRRRRGGCLLGLAVLVVLLGLGGAYAYYVYRTVLPAISAGQAHLEHALTVLRTDPPTALTPELLDQAHADLQHAGGEFRTARIGAGPLLAVAPALGWLPQVGGDVSQAPALLALAVDGSDLGVAVVEGVQPAVAQLKAGKPAPPVAPGESGGLAATLGPLLDALQANSAAFTRARTALAAVVADRAAIDGARLSQPRLHHALDQLDGQLPLLERALTSLAGLPHAADLLLGRTTPITFLVLVQNQDELRATGGFISAVGLLTVDGGRFTHVEFQDSYAVDNPNRPLVAPPADLTRYMQAQGWYIRDANWAPDFPRSAQTAETFYGLDKGQTVDGTLAVDQQMLQELLAATGPLTLTGYPDQVTADNVVDLLRHYFQPDPNGMSNEWWYHRKDFMRDLFHAVASSLPNLPRSRLLALAVALAQGLDQKHLLLRVHDPETATWLAANGWDGALGPGPGDTLAVVDSNLGFNKVNAHIAERIGYTRTLATAPDAPPAATLALTYRNSSPVNGQPCVQEARYKSGYAALTEGCYWDYVRVYVPAGSALTGATWGADSPSIQQSSEYSMTVFSVFLTVAPGEERTLVLHYSVPAAAGAGAAGAYDLRVRKQPGTGDVPLSVALQLPPGAALRTAQPAAGPAPPGWVAYTALPLDTDRLFHAGW